MAGPDAGLTHALTVGHPVLIGRHRSSGISLADPDISRHHAEISASDDGLTVRDLGSANGTRVADQLIGNAVFELRPGDLVRLGNSTLAVRTPTRPAAAVTPDAEGHLMVNRRASQEPLKPFALITFPQPLSTPPRPQLPWLMMLAPLLLAVPLALLWRQPAYLLIAAMSPLLMLGQYATDRRRGGRESRWLAKAHRKQTLEAEEALEMALSRDAEYLETVYPDLARLAVTARVPTDDLWLRTPRQHVALAVRIGRGEEPSCVIKRDPGRSGPEDTGETHPVLPDVPVGLELRDFSVVGICGPRRAVLGTARAVIGQLAVLHSPRDISIGLLQSQPTGSGEAEADQSVPEWEWLTWLPHHSPDPSASPGAIRVLVLDGARRLRRRPDVAETLSRAGVTDPGDTRETRHVLRADPLRTTHAAGTVVFCLEQDEASLPLECTATIVHTDGADDAVLHRAGQVPRSFLPDLAGARWADRLARDLAPLRDATPDARTDIPRQVRLVDLLRQVQKIDPLDGGSLAQAWRSGPAREERGSTVAVLGQSAAGPVTVDLRADGPHALIGGTTGSGKSELLQTLISSLAAGTGPDQLILLLVDYKGGAAFQACTGLPHVGAVLTDLDLPSARRALSSFTAELRRRERLLLQAGATDVDAYATARAHRPELEPMPRLVVVVDEFRVLAEELPEFVTGLVRIATVGRSLGVHLVLATQRPAGVVSPDIAANVNLRIALRVRDAADSQDLIAGPAAAWLPAIPGRALLRVGAAAPVEFQAARVNAHLPADQGIGTPVVRLLRSSSPAVLRAEPTDEPASDDREDRPGDLERLVDSTRSAAAALGLVQARAPWLPELPSELELGRLRRGSRPEHVIFGLSDLPHEQRQEEAGWDLTAGHLAIVGGARSGRSGVLRTLSVSATKAEDPRVHTYVLDSSGGLVDLETRGVARAVVRLDDHERAGRLLRRLGKELYERQRPVSGSGSRVLLLVDGWDALITARSEPGGAALLDCLLAVLRDGPAAAMNVAVTGALPLLTGPHSSLFTQRLVLSLPDPVDAMMAGVPAELARSPGRPGRGAWLSSGHSEFHVVQVARSVSEPVGSAAGEPGTTDDGWAVPALPTRVSRSALSPAEAPGKGSGIVVPIGIGGDQARTVGLDVTAAPVTLILGSRGSGRTTALFSLAEGLEELGVPTFILDHRTARRTTTAADLTARLTLLPSTVVLMDLPPVPGAAVPDDGDLAEALSAHLAGAHGEEGHLVLTASGHDVVGAYRGPLLLARGARQGLVLGVPTLTDGEAFGLRLDRHPAGPPGRGVLVAAGTMISVQVAHPASAGAPGPGDA
ncbi:FtsK/SpoIIIE domain-containing protein [Kineosporia sp. NBRC 101731]|uniref:FtsK/SpoIIIE domain-containing protein n=1 Tax=Kineosporia sp. NBRC 101731 TaxID=3032199 RepID=UPI002554B881|nr:FtsK/SpoIIIE domain-containing protein [Kineosporia sp. NBRC 101731]